MEQHPSMLPCARVNHNAYVGGNQAIVPRRVLDTNLAINRGGVGEGGSAREREGEGGRGRERKSVQTSRYLTFCFRLGRRSARHRRPTLLPSHDCRRHRRCCGCRRCRGRRLDRCCRSCPCPRTGSNAACLWCRFWVEGDGAAIGILLTLVSILWKARVRLQKRGREEGGRWAASSVTVG